MGSAVIYHQEIIQDITLLTSEPKAKFCSELFSPLDLSNFPDSDKDCCLGVHTASNQHNEKNFEFYLGYKNHVKGCTKYITVP